MPKTNRIANMMKGRLSVVVLALILFKLDVRPFEVVIKFEDGATGLIAVNVNLGLLK